MKNQNEKQINCLNTLLTRCYDAEKGFKEAAEDVDNTQLKTWFNECSQQRNQFGHELKDCINRMGGKPERGSSVAAGLHRAWMDVKSALSTNDEKAIVNECLRGENKACEDYEEAVNEYSFDPHTRSILTNQKTSIENKREDLKRIQTHFEATA